MPRKKGVCPKCGKYRVITYHHIFPRYHFRKQKNAPMTLVCRYCHNIIETMIGNVEKCEDRRKGYAQKREKFVYIDIVINFYNGIDMMKWANIHARTMIIKHQKRQEIAMNRLRKQKGKWKNLRELQAEL